MKLLMVVIAVVFQTVVMAGTAVAEEKNWELVMWQGSKHFDAPPEGRSFNELNPGIGLRKYLTGAKGVEIFVDANYISKNSTGGEAVLAGIGGQCPIVSMGHADLLVGAAIGVMQYKNAWEHETYVTPGAYPFVGVRYKDVTLTVGYIPEVSTKNTSTYEAVFAYAGIRF